MNFRLRYPPTPAYAAQHADLVVAPALSVDQVNLDYSPGSLKDAEAILESMRRAGDKPEQIAETLFSFGCYVGEVLIRDIGGAWSLPENTSIPKEVLRHFPFMVVVTGGGSVWNPISKAFAFFQAGQTESLHHLWGLAREKG